MQSLRLLTTSERIDPNQTNDPVRSADLERVFKANSGRLKVRRNGERTRVEWPVAALGRKQGENP